MRPVSLSASLGAKRLQRLCTLDRARLEVVVGPTALLVVVPTLHRRSFKNAPVFAPLVVSVLVLVISSAWILTLLSR